MKEPPRQLRLHRDERGFTLVEMLIVLFIVSVVTVVAGSMLFRFYEWHVYEQAEERLRLTFHYTQRLAEERQENLYVYSINSKQIDVRTLPGEVLFSWTLPEGMRANIDTLGKLNRIIFKGNGNIAQIGEVIISTPHTMKKYTLNLSKGRVRVNE